MCISSQTVIKLHVVKGMQTKTEKEVCKSCKKVRGEGEEKNAVWQADEGEECVRELGQRMR